MKFQVSQLVGKAHTLSQGFQRQFIQEVIPGSTRRVVRNKGKGGANKVCAIKLPVEMGFLQDHEKSTSRILHERMRCSGKIY